MVALGAERQDIVGITAAMLYPVGLDRFAAAYPERIFDVGIAEQHAVTSAAGLAMGGMHPVVAVYATFLNRAFDQVLMDVALHRCGVTFVLDRAGVTGTDGASHNGMWDLSILQVVPGLRIAAPRDGARVRELLREAVAVDDAPTVVRLPKGAPPDDLEAVDRAGGCDVLVRRGAKDVLVVGVGSMASVAVEVGRAARRPGHRRDRRRPALGQAARPRPRRASPATTGSWSASRTTAGSAVSAPRCSSCSATRASPRRSRCTASRRSSCSHAERQAILDRIGLNAQTIARGIVERLAAEGHEPLSAPSRSQRQH